MAGLVPATYGLPWNIGNIGVHELPAFRASRSSQ
jgi:hypothetical protein